MTNPRDEWRGLDAETRRAVVRNARQLRAHPDPAVAAVAERYARHALDRWSSAPVRWGMVLAAGLVAGAGVGIAASSALVSPGVVAAVTAALVMAMASAHQLRVRSLSKMELANRLARVPAANAPPARDMGTAMGLGQVPSARRDLVIRFDRGRILRLLGLPFIILCLSQAYFWWLSGTALRWFFGYLSVLVVATMVMVAVRVLRWGPPGRPIMRLDADGLHVPKFGYTLPWTELAEVRMVPLRTPRRGRGQPTTVVAFLPADPEAVLRDLRAKGGGRSLERSTRLYGTPLSIADQAMDQTADQIAVAANAFVGTPVRWY